ncbi:hypothetical protein [Macrococcoides caseolyticum]|uniref:hypothetical protein n=1 Tax=Macrococcoides caseolyticum TaxID=69966 RepID=UPI0012FF51DB|nr:hypothetical protein [Macrococcus caseolyticus]
MEEKQLEALQFTINEKLDEVNGTITDVSNNTTDLSGKLDEIIELLKELKK